MLDVDLLRGTVLMDNTTLFGARRAFEWDSSSRRPLPPGVDLRSLMDVLEAIVLVNEIVVDSSSRDDPAWPDLEAFGSFYFETELIDSFDPVVESELYRLSIEKVQHLVTSGQLETQLGFLPSLRDVEVLPAMYRDTADFVTKTVDAMSATGSEFVDQDDVQRRLADFSDGFDALAPALRNFAWFAFRGFFYQELAHMVSASYMPHSWRSGLVRSQLGRAMPRFTEVALAAGGRARQTLEAVINREFDADALTAQFPLVASFVAAQASRRDDLLPVAVQLRNTAKATAFRTWLYEVEDRIRDERDLKKIKQAQDELTTLVHELETELGVRTKPTQQVTLKLALPLPVGPSVESQFGVRSPNWLQRILQRKTHLVFLRELAEQSTVLPPFHHAYQALRA